MAGVTREMSEGGVKNNSFSDENQSPEDWSIEKLLNMDMGPSSESSESLDETFDLFANAMDDDAKKLEQKFVLDSEDSKKSQEKVVLQVSNQQEKESILLAHKEEEGKPMMVCKTYEKKNSFYGPKDYGFTKTNDLTPAALFYRSEIYGRDKFAGTSKLSKRAMAENDSSGSSDPPSKKIKSSDRFGSDWAAESAFGGSRRTSQAERYNQSLLEMDDFKKKIDEQLNKGIQEGGAGFDVFNKSSPSESPVHFKDTNSDNLQDEDKEGEKADAEKEQKDEEEEPKKKGDEQTGKKRVKREESLVYLGTRKSSRIRSHLKTIQHYKKKDAVSAANLTEGRVSGGKQGEDLPILLSPKKEPESPVNRAKPIVELKGRNVVLKDQIQQRKDHEQTTRQPTVQVERLADAVVPGYNPVVQVQPADTPARGGRRGGGGGRGGRGGGRGGRGGGRGGRGGGRGGRGGGRGGRGGRGGIGDQVCNECGQMTPVGNAHQPLHQQAPLNSQQRKSIRKRLGHFKKVRIIRNDMVLANEELQQGQARLRLTNQVKIQRLRRRYGDAMVNEAQNILNEAGGGQQLNLNGAGAQNDDAAGGLDESLDSDATRGSDGESSSSEPSSSSSSDNDDEDLAAEAPETV